MENVKAKGGNKMFEDIKRDIINTGIAMRDYQLIALSGGNVSVRIDDEHILVTPSGMNYDGMVEDDIVVVDINGKIVEGTRRPSVDHEAILYILKKMPGVNAVIHTHQPYATAVGLIEDELPAAVTTLCNTTLGPVTVAPYSSAASVDMGIKTVEYIGDKLAVILKHHGVMTVGKDLKQALYAAIYMEEAAKTYLVARAAGNVALMTQQQINEAVEVHKTYGQKK